MTLDEVHSFPVTLCSNQLKITFNYVWSDVSFESTKKVFLWRGERETEDVSMVNSVSPQSAVVRTAEEGSVSMSPLYY